MINYGRQTVAPGTVTRYTLSPDLEYVSVINESPYILTCTFSGLGFMDIPAWHREDVKVAHNQTIGFDGRLDINPQNISSGQASPQSTTVSINGYAPGELEVPQSVSLTRMVNPSQNIFAELFAGIEFTNNAAHTLTLPNVAGKTLFLDRIDMTNIAAASNDTITLTVNAIVTGLDYSYFSPSSSTVPGVLDHIDFAQRGIQQAANTAITIVVTPNVAAVITNVNAHYHYETNF